MSLESGGKALSAIKWQRTWLSFVPVFVEDTTVSADIEEISKQNVVDSVWVLLSAHRKM